MRLECRVSHHSWLSAADLFPCHLTCPLGGWLSSPVPTQVVSEEAKAAHISRTPMKAAKEVA